MKAINSRNREVLADDVVAAESVVKRIRGLLGRQRIDRGEALWIRPCRGIHTIGMRFHIDAVFMDRRNVVVALMKDLPPNRVTSLYFRAVSVLELPAGTLAAAGIEIGDAIEIH